MSGTEGTQQPGETPTPATAPDKSPKPQAIILAAGKGKRMAAGGGDTVSPDGNPLPKVLYPAAGKPMVWWVVQACKAAGVERCILVIGYEGEQVKAALADETCCVYVEQTEQLGTGHAARMAEPLFTDQPATDVFVLAGDGPLIRPQTLELLLKTHRDAGPNGAAATLATAQLDDPTGYGRVIRSADGGLETIVEHKDCTPKQLQVREVNPSYYCFQSDLLFAGLARVKADNSQGEYYITDVPALLKGDGHPVAVVDAVPSDDIHSVNTPEQLALVDAILRRRLATKTDQANQATESASP